DFARTTEALMMLLPEADRTRIAAEAQRTVKTWLKADLVKDLLPNIGPDWGVCVLPAKNPHHLPHALGALAVKPGQNGPRIDQSLFEGLQRLVGLGVLKYNQNHPGAIRLHTVKQDTTAVLYLTGEKSFPPGMEPACALKDGYLLFASSAETIS